MNLTCQALLPFYLINRWFIIWSTTELSATTTTRLIQYLTRLGQAKHPTRSSQANNLNF